MKPSFAVDYLIVGQGLAGSALAVQLLLRDRNILVIDKPSLNVSSVVAPGLFNPLTGRKMVKTWMAEEIFAYLHSFYRKVEDLTLQKFFYPIPIYRPFLSIEEQNEWMAATADSSLAPIIKKVSTTSAYPEFINDPFGGLFLNQCGYIDTAQYLAAVRKQLVEKGAFVEEVFDSGALAVNGSTIRYKNFVAQRIIFSEGMEVAKNALFSWLPIRPLKGEILEIEAVMPTETVINRGVYVVPGKRSNVWRVGATYDHGTIDAAPSQEGKQELETKLKQLVKTNYKITGHHAGIRPTTPDRRPIIGSHPEDSKVVIFNGFGTKGVSLTPYFSEVLVRSLENSAMINKEVDISRYKSLYWKSPK